MGQDSGWLFRIPLPFRVIFLEFSRLTAMSLPAHLHFRLSSLIRKWRLRRTSRWGFCCLAFRLWCFVAFLFRSLLLVFVTSCRCMSSWPLESLFVVKLASFFLRAPQGAIRPSNSNFIGLYEIYSSIAAFCASSSPFPRIPPAPLYKRFLWGYFILRPRKSCDIWKHTAARLWASYILHTFECFRLGGFVSPGRVCVCVWGGGQ